MATDIDGNLHRPLMPPKRLMERLAPFVPHLEKAVRWFNRIGGAVLALVLIVLSGWIFFQEDPLGGEPMGAGTVQVASNPRPSATAMDDTEAVLGELRQPLPPEPGGQAPGGPQVLRVPQPASMDGDEMASAVPASTPNDGPRFDSRGGLDAVADSRLVERFDSDSFIPRIGPSGERPLDVYARPLEAGTVAPGQPRVGIIVGGLGLSQTSTQEVINTLPAAMTLSFAPYGGSLNRWAARARQDGHEYLIEVPMEPFDYPNNDPGPHTLQVGLGEVPNVERLHWALSRLPTPVGIMNYMGARFTSEPDALAPILSESLGRGLLVVDDGRSARSQVDRIAPDGAPVLRADVVVDARADQDAINTRLRQLEAIARDRGTALGVATALPLTISSLEEWSASLATKGIALVPASSFVRF